MKQYHELLQTILEKGVKKSPAREDMPGSTSYFGYQFRHNLNDGFPLLTTKKMFWKGMVMELIWFLRGDTNIKFLDEHGVTKFWHEDSYNYYRKIAASEDGNVKYILKPLENGEFEPFSFKEFCDIIHETERDLLPKYGSYVLGECGYQYGKVWRDWDKFTAETTRTGQTWKKTGVDQIARLIANLNKGPEGRRHVITAWDPAHDSDLALTWCHAIFQFNCRALTIEERCELRSKSPSPANYTTADMVQDAVLTDLLDKDGIPKFHLDCLLFQRSADTILGVPMNIASYSLLIHLIAKICNMVPGEFIHTFGDVHIYDNHLDAAKEQLGRDFTKYPLPTVSVLEKHPDHGSLPDHFEKYLTKRIDLDQFLKSLTYHDFRLENYQSYPKLESETELSTGMKK